MSAVRTLPVYPDRALPEVSFLPGTPAEATALAFVAARQFPADAQGDGSQSVAQASPPIPNCAGAVRAAPATFSAGDSPSLAEVFGAIRAACRAAGSQSAWAASIGVSPQYLSDVLNCRRDPGGAILRALGLRRVVTYVGMGKWP